MILIIAYGNSLREDDGAGLVLAERLETELRRLAVEVYRVESQQLLPELAAEISDGASAVVFADTRLATADRERVAVDPVMPAAASPGLGHHLDPGALMAYARILSGATPPPAWLVTVPGWQFGFGEHLSVYSEESIFLAFDDPQSQLQRLVGKLLIL